VSWLRRFGEPIVLRDGARLMTLGDAIAYLANIIPESERDMPEVQTASRLLTNAAEQGDPVDFARIAVLQAIDHHAARVFGPSRKDPQALIRSMTAARKNNGFDPR
jgi:hypothetical protein